MSGLSLILLLTPVRAWPQDIPAAGKPADAPALIVITQVEPNPPRIGEPVTLKGSNFGRAEGTSIFIGGYGVGIGLQVIEWKHDAVTATIPDDPRIRRDQNYYFRITRLVPREASNPYYFRFDKKIENQVLLPPAAAIGGAAGKVMPPPKAKAPSVSPAADAAGAVPVPPLQGRVTDLTGTLNPGQLASLESSLRAFEQKKGSQIAVLMLASTHPETIEQYSMRVAERWKIGRAKIDDGVILVIAKDDRRLRIEVGYGLEGAIPDVVAKRVIREAIAPRFLNNDYHGGIRDGAQTLMKLIAGEKLPPRTATQTQRSTLDRWLPSLGWLAPFVVTLGLPLMVLLILLAGRGLRGIFGRLPGSMATGVVAGYIFWALIEEPVFAVAVGVIAFFAMLSNEGSLQHTGASSSSGWSSGSSSGWSSSSSSGFSSSGGGSSGGGGGSFGGGGASGSW